MLIISNGLIISYIMGYYNTITEYKLTSNLSVTDLDPLNVAGIKLFLQGTRLSKWDNNNRMILNSNIVLYNDSGSSIERQIFSRMVKSQIPNIRVLSYLDHNYTIPVVKSDTLWMISYGDGVYQLMCNLFKLYKSFSKIKVVILFQKYVFDSNIGLDIITDNMNCLEVEYKNYIGLYDKLKINNIQKMGYFIKSYHDTIDYRYLYSLI